MIRALFLCLILSYSAAIADVRYSDLAEEKVQLNYTMPTTKVGVVDKVLQKSVISGNQEIVKQNLKYDICSQLTTKKEFYDSDGKLSRTETVGNDQSIYCVNKIADAELSSKLVDLVSRENTRRGLIQGAISLIGSGAIYKILK